MVARIVGQKVGERLGQPILIESKPGAGGAIAINELMRADPDGYTLLVTTSSHATLPALDKAAVASEQRLHAGRQRSIPPCS